MSPVYDLIMFEMVFVPTEDPGEFLMCCPFCNEGIALVTLPKAGLSMADLLSRGKHTCPGADASLGHVIYKRSRTETGRFLFEYQQQVLLAAAAKEVLTQKGSHE